VFARRQGGLFELGMALVCLWAAYHHTPVGALLRQGVATALGRQSSTRPLLAYFSGGARSTGAAPVVALHPGGALTPALAAGLGLHAALRQLPVAERAEASALARTHGVDPEALADGRRGPAACTALVARAARALGSEEAAVLAAFAGLEPARYARERAAAEGVARPALEDLARALPPGFEDAVERAGDALALGVAFRLDWPVASSARVSSPFGERLHPTLGVRKLHTGVDLAVPVGTPVRAVADGQVRRASFDRVNGNILVLDHGRGVTTAYCHNDQLLVAPGTRVRRGQLIARSGNTGRSTGPHLHYQLEVGARPVDPFAFRPPPSPPSVVQGGPE
jgi:murein DD-endopeptidase